MKTNRRLSLIAVLGLACLGWGTSSQATTIDWGTYFSSTTYLFDSTGAPLTSEYVFELGSFGTFVPTAANMNDWLTNWKPFDRAVDTDGWIPSSGTVGSSATLESDLTTDNATLSQSNTFAQGEQAYIWVYKGTAGSPDSSSGLEWALVTNDSSDANLSDDWLFPAPSGHGVLTLDWRIEDATASPFGGLNDTQYDGSYSSTPPAFILQTHTTATVPEPGTGLLLGLTALGLIRRKRVTRA